LEKQLNDKKQKFAILTLVFYGNYTLRRMLANTGAYVDRIYLSYSPVPWSHYNNRAREAFQSDFDKSQLAGFPFAEKITLLEGVWVSEEDQRNHALEAARQDGIDYLIIQDADEFYLPEDFQRNLEGIRENPNYPVYRCPWTVFWKTTGYVIQVLEHEGKPRQTVTTCPNFAVNVNWPGIHFSSRRLVNAMDQVYMLDGLCLHLAWVLSDAEVQQKISTWGHSHQFDTQKWYRHKWLAWRPGTKHLGHITRAGYLAAVPYHGVLPREIQDLPQLAQNYQPLSCLARLDCWLMDALSLFRVKLSGLKRKLSR
jgi:hypothetical protein